MDSLDSQMRHIERVNWCRGLMRMRVGRHHSASPASQVGSLHVRRQLSLPFVPPVLKPNFDLRWRMGGSYVKNEVDKKKLRDISCDD